MEFDPQGTFEDRASQVFINRKLPPVEFKVFEKDGLLTIDSQYLHLEYRVNKLFSPNSLSILIKENNLLWKFGDLDRLNLKGTCRTLDQANGNVPLENGLLSLAGYSVVNDSHSLVFTSEGWITPRDKPGNYQDFYFFGYNRDHLACIRDYQTISGAVPLIPRWALGNWWSRYWAYSAEELTELMDEFQLHKVPLSVCMVDMDWHITQTSNTSSGWTGFTWNKALFPDPKLFIGELHAKDLKVSLNLHPAEGIHPHEENYQHLADFLGVAASKNEPIHFDCADKEFMDGYFNKIIQPLEEDGVDFWWIDWQQGDKSKMPGLDPLFWLNHLHSLQMEENKAKRSFILSRWPGLGGHRYPAGFSGDTYVTWDSLKFQPYFTSTAANVAFGWWSHDIGGHMGGIEEPELYLRWVQYGVFSPILRLHSTKNRFNERLPWGFDAETEKNAIHALQLRKQLIPYIYTSAWNYHQGGIPICLPMYYHHPGKAEAYLCTNQYYFGNDLIVAPITTPADRDSLHARQVVWLPEGNWYDFFSGEKLTGSGWISYYATAGDIPVFAREGAIIPLDGDNISNGSDLPNTFDVRVFAGQKGSCIIFEDDGYSQKHKNGEYAITTIEQDIKLERIQLKIDLPSNQIPDLPARRTYNLSIYGINQPDSITVNKHLVTDNFSFDENHNILHFSVEAVDLSQLIEITIMKKDGVLGSSSRLIEKIDRFVHRTKAPTNVKSQLINDFADFIQDPRKFTTIASKLSLSQLIAIGEMISGVSPEPLADNLEDAKLDLLRKFLL